MSDDAQGSGDTQTSGVTALDGEPDLGVFVVGMHRTGMSPITRMLNLLGVPLGDAEALRPPDELSPTGTWEVRPLAIFNNQLLRDLGGTAKAPPLLSGTWTGDERLTPRGEEAREAFYRYHRPGQWVWKDARNSFLLPFWLKVLEVRPVVVLTWRHPQEVAASLASRHGLSIPFGLMLWERYMRHALTGAQGLPVLVTRYDDLLRAPEGWAASAREFLVAHGTDCSAASAGDSAAFVDPSLRNFDFDAGADVDGDLSDAQRELVACLEALEPCYGEFQALALPEETPWIEPLFAERRVLLQARRDAARERREAEREWKQAARERGEAERQLKRARRKALLALKEPVERIEQDLAEIYAPMVVGADQAVEAEQGALMEHLPVKRLLRDVSRARSRLDAIIAAEAPSATEADDLGPDPEAD